MHHLTNDYYLNLDVVDRSQPFLWDAFASHHLELNQPDPQRESFCFSDIGSWASSSSSWSLDGCMPESIGGEVLDLQAVASFVEKPPQQLIRFDGYHETMDYSWLQSNGQCQYFGTSWNGFYAEPAAIVEPNPLPDYPMEPPTSSLSSNPSGHWLLGTDLSTMICRPT